MTDCERYYLQISNAIPHLLSRWHACGAVNYQCQSARDYVLVYWRPASKWPRAASSCANITIAAWTA